MVVREEPPPRAPPPAPPAPPAPSAPPRRTRPFAAVQPVTSPPVQPAPQRPGFLSFTSSPPADVYEGDRLLGATPLLDRAVNPGVHAFRFVLRDGSATRTVSVDVQPGASSLVNVSWRPHGEGAAPEGHAP